VVIGEISRCDFVEEIAVDDIEEPEPCQAASVSYSRLVTFWKPHRRYQGKPWSVRAAQLVAAAAQAHCMIMDADIQFNHWELSASSLISKLVDPLNGVMAPPAEGEAASAPVCAAVVSLNAPRSFLSDDGIVHLFSALVMHGCLGTRVHQSHGGEFSLRADFNALLLQPCATPIQYHESYCVQAQLITRALAQGELVVERLMRGKWHAKIGLAKILDPVGSVGGKSRIDLVTERLFDDAARLAGMPSATGRVQLIAANKTYTLPQDEGSGARSAWVERSRQIQRVSGVSPMLAPAPREGFQEAMYPDPLAQAMCVLAPPIARKEVMAALKRFLRDYLAHDLALLPDHCSLFADEVLPVLHTACNASRGAFRVAPDATCLLPACSDERDRGAIVFGATAWSRATVTLMLGYARTAAGSDARRAVVHANRLSWLLGTLAYLNASVSDDWGAAHERLDDYCAAFREAYLHTH